MTVICPVCHKKAWAPYKFPITSQNGKKYWYLIYRHPEKKRKSPTKHYVPIKRKRKARR